MSGALCVAPQGQKGWVIVTTFITTFITGFAKMGSTYQRGTVVTDGNRFAFRLADGTLLRRRPTIMATQDHVISVLAASDYSGSIRSVPVESFRKAEHAWKIEQSVRDYVLDDRWTGSKGYTREQAERIANWK